jgi:hypothetical protein
MESGSVARLAEQLPSAVHLQIKHSGSVVRLVCRIVRQSCRYWPTSWMPRTPWMSWAKALAYRPSATVLACRWRLETQLYNCGAISLMVRPPILWSSQNNVACPLPTNIVVDAKNNARSSSMNWSLRFLHALFVSVRLNPNHWRHKARPVCSRSRTPSPPIDFCLHTRLIDVVISTVCAFAAGRKEPSLNFF